MGKKRRKKRKTRQQKEEEEETYDIDSAGQRNEVKEKEQEDRGDCYEINPKHPGIAVILNHEHYDDDDDDVRRRFGTQHDLNSLTESLEKLGFEVFPYNDLTHKEIKDVLEKVAKDNHSNGDCLVVAVMTHGCGGGYLSARDKVYKTSELWEIFKGGTFKEKPKLFFIQVLKVMGKKRRKTRQQKEEETCDIDSAGQRNEVKEEEQEDRGDCYEINHQHPGIAVILNHEKYDDNYVRRRFGTQHDLNSLTESLEKLGFEVFPYNDLTHKEIKDVLEEVAKENHSNGDCLVVAVMTHGCGGGYLCARDKMYKTSELWEIFKGGTFKGKPKLFFIQVDCS